MYLSSLSLNSLRNSRQQYLSALLLILVLSAAILPFKAQSQDIISSTEIAQSPHDAKEAEAQKIAEKALDLWKAEDFATLRPYLSSSLQALLPVDELKRFWKEQVEQLGKIKKIGRSRAIDAINSYIVFIPVEFENMKGNVSVTVNKKNEVVGVNFPTKKTIEEIAEQSVEAIDQGDLIKARDNFTPALKAEISPQNLQKQWQAIEELAGPFKRIVKSEVRMGQTVDDPNLILVTIEFEKVTDDMFFIFDQKKQIIGVDFPIIDD